MNGTTNDIRGRVPGFVEALRPVCERLLANLVLIGEIPAPTFDEGQRITFLKHRFNESGLQNCSTDEAGNALAMLPGKVGERNILLTAHADTIFPRNLDHSLSIFPNRVVGPGIADNSLGLAVLATIPALLEQLDIQLDANLILMGAVRSLGGGNLEGLRFFLSHSDLPLYAGLCIEGVQLGRLNYVSLASLGCEVICEVENKDGSIEHSGPNAISVLNEIINRLDALSLEALFRTRIILGQIDGGSSFDSVPQTATLRFEIRSESDVVLAELEQRVDEIIRDVSSTADITVSFKIIARRRLGGLSPDHLLVGQVRSIMQELGVQPTTVPYSSAVSAFVDHGIPAILVGITTGQNLTTPDEAVIINPIFTGIAQIIGILLAIDGGICD